MSHENFRPREAPNYTTAFFAVMGTLTFFTLWVVAGLFGFIWVFISAYIAELLYRARRSRS
ncbi:MAG: hypothetical protein AAGF13_07790 [Pseudomonadota bacterium]